MFEEEYVRTARLPEFADRFVGVDTGLEAEDAHDGYFSIDRHRRWTDTSENTQANRENAERAYSLIMRDKEKLLALDTELRFLFSHSALKEGWDNPNVFQICALREIGTEQERRQTIGRGLRLCVNQQGERLHDHSLNTLTVIATERYEDFRCKPAEGDRERHGHSVWLCDGTINLLPFQSYGMTGLCQCWVLTDRQKFSVFCNRTASSIGMAK